MTTPLAITQNPYGLVETLRDHGVHELGGLYLYLPLPRSAADQEAWAWLETARLVGAVRSGPYQIEAARAQKQLRITHPKLFTNAPAFFEVFRLDSDRLATLIDKVDQAGRRHA